MGTALAQALFQGVRLSSKPFAGQRVACRIKRWSELGPFALSRASDAWHVHLLRLSFGLWFPARTIPGRSRVALVVGSARAGGGQRHHERRLVELARRSGHGMPFCLAAVIQHSLCLRFLSCPRNLFGALAMSGSRGFLLRPCERVTMLLLPFFSVFVKGGSKASSIAGRFGMLCRYETISSSRAWRKPPLPFPVRFAGCGRHP